MKKKSQLKHSTKLIGRHHPKEEELDSISCDLSTLELIAWPCFVRPKSDELFSSWLVRNAYSHYTKVYTFYHFQVPHVSIWDRDIDRCASNDFLLFLESKTDTNLKDIRDSMLTSFEGRLFRYHNRNAITNWLLPAGIYSKRRLRHSLCFCPSCLKEDGNEPYYRKNWRLSLFTVCPHCKCMLYDECPNCNAPIVFFRLDLGNKMQFPDFKLSCCYKCKYDLSNSPVIDVSELILQFQKRNLDILKGKYFPKSKDIIDYFEGLNILVGLLCSGRKGLVKFQELLFRELRINNFIKKGGISNSFHWKRLSQRHVILSAIQHLVDDWPNTFIKILKESNTYKSTITIYKDNVPSWIRRAL